MENITENDLYKIIRGLVNFPFPRICVHSVAFDLISLMEKKGAKVDSELSKAVVRADDYTATKIIDEKMKENGNNMDQEKSKNIKEELQNDIAKAVKEFLLKKYYSENEISCRFGDISLCSATIDYAEWIMEKTFKAE